MLIRGNTLDEGTHLEMASDTDVCTICAENLANKENIRMWEAEQKLKGKYTGQPIFKVGVRGSDFIICKDCLSRIDKKAEEYMPKPSKPEPPMVKAARGRKKEVANEEI